MNSHHHGRPPPSGVGRTVESSNSTANKFLGATRKPWMLGGVPTRSEQPRLEPSQRPPAPASDANSAPSSLQLRTPAPTTSPRDKSQAGTTPSAPQVSAPSIAQGTQNTTTISYAGPAPVSPVTPGGKLPEASSCDSLSLKQIPAAAVDAPATTPELVQTCVLPSPEPSNNGSHTSPACAADGDQEDSRPAGADLPLMLESSQLPEEAGAGALIPARVISPASMAGPPERRSERPRLETSQADVHHVTSSTPLSATSAATNSDSGQASSGVPPEPSFWKIARIRLQLFIRESTERNALSETVELPRVRLLQDACRFEDIFYIALHQVYCVSSYAPSQLAGLARFAIQRGYGFDVIKQLLVDNQNLSGDFLKWCVYYPSPLRFLFENKDYRNALQQVGHALALISQRWVSFEKELQARSYPPLVEELVTQFGITSPVLQGIIFTALIRRLFGSRNEQLMRACQTLFERDQKLHQDRLGGPPIPVEVLQREKEVLVRNYQVLSQKYAAVAQLPSPVSQMQSPTTHMNTTPVNITAANTPPVTAVTRPQMRPGSTPNSAVESNSPLSNTHTSTSMPPQMVGLPSNMRSNNRSQAQRRPPPPSQQPPQQPPQQRVFIQQHPAPYPVQTSSQPLPVSAPATSGAPPQATGMYFDPRFPVQSHMYPVVPPVQGSMAPAASTRSHIANYPSTNNINGQGQGIPHSGAQYPHPLAYPATALGMGVPQGVTPNQQPTYGPPLPSHIAPSQMPPTAPSMRFPSQQSVSRARPPQSQQMPPVQQVQHVPLLPPAGVVPPTRPPNPTVTAIHQMHLRTPPTRLVRLEPNGGEATDLIQYLSAFAIRPTPLEFERSSFRWQFSVSPGAYQRRPRWVEESNGCPVQLLSDGVRTYRFRCVQYRDPSEIQIMPFWCGTECKWPSVVYIHVNGRELFVRRAFHHGKDLPVDITSYLKEGTNEISLNMLRTEHEKSKDITYAIAVEVLEVRSASRVREVIHRLPAVESREQIRKRLSMQSNDDDLVVMDDYITIDLRDPFTARVFDTPVRGRSCTHRECFDLDTFLQTVVMTPATTGKRAPYLRCPICRKDARPSYLLVDEFLIEVRSELERTQRLEHTRSIRVKADGSWEPVLEKETPQPSVGAGSGSVLPAKRNWSAFEADLSETAKADGIHHDSAPGPEVIELD
ncbi:hypothetical protein VTN77DRAFT_630 [Rasamsonia byssochlamydoides]|uniref:uncharacterized protein n=1 Tax=Rasamsonia byssochlamydoides TaxID=89139 RepID=UPI003743D0E1